MPDILHPDTSLAAELDAPHEQPIDPGDFVVCGTAEDPIEAELLLRACEDAGIPAILRSPRSGLVGKLAAPVDAWVILAPVEDQARAQALITEQRAALANDPDGAARAAEAAEAEEETQAAADLASAAGKPSAG